MRTYRYTGYTSAGRAHCKSNSATAMCSECRQDVRETLAAPRSVDDRTRNAETLRVNTTGLGYHIDAAEGDEVLPDPWSKTGELMVLRHARLEPAVSAEELAALEAIPTYISRPPDPWARGRQAQVRTAMTDVDLRDALSIALMDADPAFLGIVAVDPDEGTVIYRSGASDVSREFEWGDDDAIVLGAAQRVRGETRYVPAARGDVYSHPPDPWATKGAA